MTPRWYQSEAVEAAWAHLCSQSGSPVIVLPTGAGKSLCIAMLAHKAREFNGRVIVLAHRRELLEQNAEKIRSFGLDVGIYSAGLKSRDTDHDVVLGGIQSVYKKAGEFGPRHLVVIDEVHLVGDEGMYQTFLTNLRALNPKLRLVGLTATPFRTSEGGLCRPDALFQKICYSAPIGRLIEEGFLSPLTTSPADVLFDTSDLHIRGGEFISGEMAALFSDFAKIESACQEIVGKTQGRKSTLVFCAGVIHAGTVARTLESQTGEECGLVTGDTLPLERASLLSRFKSGDLKRLCNCDVLCLDEETEILTSDGWCGIDEMNASKKIAAWGMDETINFTSPKLIVRRNRGESERMVSLKTNGIDIRVTANHRMVYLKNKGNNNQAWTIASAESLVGRALALPASGWADVQDIVPAIESDVTEKQLSARIRSLSYVFRNRDKMSDADSKAIARAQVLERATMTYKPPSCLTGDECQLIGFWIGDGTKSCGRVSLSQSEAYPDNIKWIDSLLHNTNISHSRKRYKPATKSINYSIRWTMARGTGGTRQKVDGYYRLEPYFEKTGTSLFWGLNRTQLLALLNGLWVADGLHHAKLKQKRVASTQKALFDLLQAICACRGIKARINKLSKPRKGSHSQQWMFSWSEERKFNSFSRNTFRLESEFKKERVWCVTSTTGQIITRRNGKVCVVGNTTGFDSPNIDAIAVLRATASAGLFAQMCGRGLRMAPGKDNCLILDFGQNIKRHGPLDAPDYGSQKKGSKGGDGDAPAKTCPNCEESCPLNAKQCSCGFNFPPKELARHEGEAGEDAILTVETEWTVEEIQLSRHKKKKGGPDDPDTLRVDYICQPIDGEGNISAKTISEWVCLEHEGYARNKALRWWKQRSKADVSSIDDAISLWTRGALACPTRLKTRPEGKFVRITSYELDTVPESWDEPTQGNDWEDSEDTPF